MLDFQSHPWPISPLSMCHTNTLGLEICLAWPKQAGRNLGKSLHPLSNLQSLAAHQSSMHDFHHPCYHFNHIHVDQVHVHVHVGPLPSSNGLTHLFIVKDCFIKWPEAISLLQYNCLHLHPSTGYALNLLPWASFGHLCDRAPQFTSQLWVSIAQLLGTQLHYTTAYHTHNLHETLTWCSDL